MKYNDFAYLWPPRPVNAIPSAMLGFQEKLGWVAQIKRNGTCNVIAVSPDKKLVCMSRHNTAHKAWQPTEESSRYFEQLPGTGWYVFVAELLHSKTKHIKDTNYVFEMLVHDGEYLINKTWQERQDMLQDLFLGTDRTQFESEEFGHWVVDANVWLAKNIKTGFKKLYASLTNVEDEGLVLKDPKVLLKLCTRQNSNAPGLIKCRKKIKNVNF